MLKKMYRGLTASEVSDLFDGTAFSKGNQYFRINWKKTDAPFPQFVVITSRKLHRSAVRRNLLRRLIYELIRRHFSDWTQGLRVAILIKTAALECNRREFRNAFLRLMQSAGLI